MLINKKLGYIRQRKLWAWEILCFGYFIYLLRISWRWKCFVKKSIYKFYYYLNWPKSKNHNKAFKQIYTKINSRASKCRTFKIIFSTGFDFIDKVHTCLTEMKHLFGFFRRQFYFLVATQIIRLKTDLVKDGIHLWEEILHLLPLFSLYFKEKIDFGFKVPKSNSVDHIPGADAINISGLLV